jgi:hypothetical protein
MRVGPTTPQAELNEEIMLSSAKFGDLPRDSANAQDQKRVVVLALP